LSLVQAAVFDRLKMVLNRAVRALFSRCAASLSLIAYWISLWLVSNSTPEIWTQVLSSD
jgi:hypothetical protein